MRRAFQWVYKGLEAGTGRRRLVSEAGRQPRLNKPVAESFKLFDRLKREGRLIDDSDSLLLRIMRYTTKVV